jgi:hypothetical protein
MTKILSPTEVHAKAEIADRNRSRYILLDSLRDTIKSCQDRITKVEMEIIENEFHTNITK